MVGYGLIDSLICGQIFSAVAGGSLSVVVGTIIASIITLVVTMFGIRLFHIYERYSGIPQLLIIMIFFGVAGPHFNPSSPTVAATSAIRSADQ